MDICRAIERYKWTTFELFRCHLQPSRSLRRKASNYDLATTKSQQIRRNACPMSCSSEARFECMNRNANSTLVGGNVDLSPHAAQRPVASLQRRWLMQCAALARCWQWSSSGQSPHQKTHAIRADSPDCRESASVAAASVESCILPTECPSTSEEAIYYFMPSPLNWSEYEAEYTIAQEGAWLLAKADMSYLPASGIYGLIPQRVHRVLRRGRCL